MEAGSSNPDPNILNVGWLSREHSFDRAHCDERFVSELARLVAQPVNLLRGSHLCEFCPAPPTVLSKGGIPMLNPPPDTTGNGEIRSAERRRRRRHLCGPSARTSLCQGPWLSSPAIIRGCCASWCHSAHPAEPPP